jgi:hypothetical protein
LLLRASVGGPINVPQKSALPALVQASFSRRFSSYFDKNGSKNGQDFCVFWIVTERRKSRKTRERRRALEALYPPGREFCRLSRFLRHKSKVASSIGVALRIVGDNLSRRHFVVPGNLSPEAFLATEFVSCLAC